MHPGRAPEESGRALDRGAALVTAEAIGSMEGAHQITVEFAKQRVQFGEPIGHYQGVKHPLADAYVDIECLKSLLYYAAWCLDESPDEAPRYVSMAKAYASEALARIGVDAVQLHGAVGYTWEYDPHLYFKRAKSSEVLLGSPAYHRELVARGIGLGEAARA